MDIALFIAIVGLVCTVVQTVIAIRSNRKGG